MTVLLRAILAELSTPLVLPFHDWDAAINGSRRFQLYCNANREGFGAALIKPQIDGLVCPIMFISRTTLDNERRSSILQLKADAIIWAIKRLRPNRS